MSYFPHVSITYMSRFFTGIRNNQDQIITSKLLKSYGIDRPSILKKCFKSVGLISEEDKLTDLGREFLDIKTRKNACRKILELHYYDELVYMMKQGNNTTRKELNVYIAGITAWKDDAVDKALAFFAYLLHFADFDELKELDFVKKAQISPRLGTRKGKKGKSP